MGDGDAVGGAAGDGDGDGDSDGDDDGGSDDTDAREGGGVDQGYNRDGDDDA